MIIGRRKGLHLLQGMIVNADLLSIGAIIRHTTDSPDIPRAVKASSQLLKPMRCHDRIAVEKEYLIPSCNPHALIASPRKPLILLIENALHIRLFFQIFHRAILRSIVHDNDLIAVCLRAGTNTFDAELRNRQRMIAEDHNARHMMFHPVFLLPLCVQRCCNIHRSAKSARFILAAIATAFSLSPKAASVKARFRNVASSISSIRSASMSSAFAPA